VRTAAILPIKSFAFAKQRLGASVEDPLRAELARAMVSDVLEALSRVRGLELTIVVTRESQAAATAAGLGALVVEDDAETGQSAAVELGVGRALAEGFERVLCVPGDCPALDPSEVEALLATAGGASPEVVIVPDRHGTGTNGLLLSPPRAIRASFGPDSCERHRALAAEAGVACRIERPSSLLLDVDTGEDLLKLRARLAGERSWAPRTREVLAGTGAGASASAPRPTQTAA
jgi:2-phospho-L-lactate/phosphoenolpyruvate guanylyltransferase